MAKEAKKVGKSRQNRANCAPFLVQMSVQGARKVQLLTSKIE